MIPKKLVFTEISSTPHVAEKVNQIIEYLEEKEKVDKTWLRKILSKDKPNYEPECPGFGDFHSDGNLACSKCSVPKKEPSKGECGIIQCECGRVFSKSGYKEHLKEGHNPPEHEEDWEKKFAKDWYDKKMDGDVYSGWSGPESDPSCEKVMIYIRANFVSKEKIKRVAHKMSFGGTIEEAKLIQEFIALLEEPGLGD